jgi:cell division protein FtsB
MKSIVWLLTPLILFLQYEIWFAQGGVLSFFKIKQRLEAETQVNQEWQQHNQAISADIHNLKNGDQAIEEHARRDLNMIKPGEVLYQLP